MERFKSILKGTAIAYGLTFICILLFSFILVNTNLKEKYIDSIIIIISSFSILISSISYGIKNKKNFLIDGIVITLLYVTVIYVVSSILGNSFSMSGSSLIFIVICIFCGIIGSLIGKNIKT